MTLDSGIQVWTVPMTAKYSVKVTGGEGGHGKWHKRGKGAVLEGTLRLQRGTRLKILVGQKGLTGNCSSPGGGGGGGTFVAFLDNTFIAVAGGGGGGGGLLTQSQGEGGQWDSKGSVNGGVGGSGGRVCSSVRDVHVGGGGGFRGNGACAKPLNCVPITCMQGGTSFLNGGDGGTPAKNDGAGGFGGGGASSGSYPGGGGGYSGGGVNAKANSGSAGGGGSFKQNGLKSLPSSNENHGFVEFTLV